MIGSSETEMYMQYEYYILLYSSDLLCSTKTHEFNRLHEMFQLYANLESYGHSATVEWLGDSSYLHDLTE